MSEELTKALSDVLPPGTAPVYPSTPESLRDFLKDNGAYRPLHAVMQIEEVHAFVQCIDYMQDAFHWERPMIFRGHRDYQWKLVPSLMRPPIFNGVPSSREVDELERELLLAFRKRAQPFLRQLPSGLEEWWEWTALAQHHFLPSRFLDWTYRAATALFFSVENRPTSAPADYACVWAIKAPRHLDTIAHKYPHADMPVQLYDPPHISPRITMQQGCFTVHPSHYLKTYFEWIEGPRVLFLIRNSLHTKIRGSLQAIGVHMASIYPDLDGISAHLTETVAKYRDLHKRPDRDRHDA